MSHAPTDISLSTNSIDENQPINTIIGNFTTTDPDAGDTHTYTLVAGIGGTDNSSFNINGNQLRSSVSFDYETKSSYSIRIRTTDQTSLYYEKVFIITINNVNEPPVITAPSATQNVLENGTLTFNSSNSNSISISDVENDNQTVTITSTNGTFTLSTLSGLTIISGSNGTGSLKFSGTLININNALNSSVFTPALNYHGNANVAIHSDDGNGGIGDATINISVTFVNSNPVITAPSTLQTILEDNILTFTGGNAISISDVDDNDQSVTITVTHGIFTLSTTSGLTICNGEMEQVLFTFAGTLIDVNAALNASYFTPVLNYNGGASIGISTDDGLGGSDYKNITISITPVDDPPVASNVNITGSSTYYIGASFNWPLHLQ